MNAPKPYPTYRPSGVTWIGDVPAHWEVRRLKQTGRLVAGAGFPVPLQGVQDEELPFFKVGDLAKSVDGRWLSYSDSTISRETAASLRAQVIPKGAIAYAKIGEALRLNRRRIIARPACIDNNMTAFVPSSAAITIEWALHSLSVLDFGKHVNPGAVPSLSEGDQAVLSIPLPPLSEQRAIVRYLDYVDRRIRRYVERQAEAHRAAGGGAAGHRQQGCHPRPRPQRPPQALRRRVAGRRAGALGDYGRLEILAGRIRKRC